MPPAADPLANQLTPPTVGTPVAFDPAHIVPGSNYSGLTLNGGTTNFPPGTYVWSGDISIKGNATVTGTDVTFYFTNGATITSTGNPVIQLSAPNTGTYAGILFYQDPSDTAGPSLGGDNTSFFQGTLYFPSAQITFFGNNSFNSTAAYSIIVAQSIALSGHPDVVINSNYSGLPGGGSIIKNAALVE
jgi:hypothetical protein